MVKESSRPFAEERESLRKKRRVMMALADSGRLPVPFARTFPPQFTSRELRALATLCETPGFEKRCLYQYKTVQTSFGRRGEVTKQGKVTDLASRALKEGGCYLKSVETTIDQLKTRELREQERWMVEGEARMEVIGVKREKAADSLREGLQEWIEDAEKFVAFNHPEMFFSVVSEVCKDDDEEDEDTGDSEIIKLSFSTRFNGSEYSIDVEMSNDSDVRVKSFPLLRGIEEIITDTLTTHSLLDAITGEFWKLAVVV